MGRLNVRRRGWTAAALAAAVVLAGACRSRADSVAYDGPFAEEVRDAIPKVERAAGLRFKRTPRLEERSQAEVRAFLEAQFQEQTAARDIDGQVAAYKRFGLFADTLDVTQLLLDLLTEQIVGFYDPDTDVLYIVEGARPEMRETIIQHELVHALQDQYVDLDSIQQLRGDNDRSTAVQAVIEGQATYEQLQAMLGPGDLAARLPGGWDRVRQTIRDQSESMPLYATAPLVLRETLVFPYLSGAEFVRRVKLADSTAIPRIRMPISTEQVLHEEAWGDSVDVPVVVELPPPSIGEAMYDNNLGEFETRLLLFQWSREQAPAIRAAAGWDGDRYVLFRTPGGGEGLAWVTVWDDAVNAGEFLNVADQALARRYRDLRREEISTQEFRYTGGDRAMRLTAVEIQGRPAVLFVDMPRGERTDGVLDASAVRLRDAEMPAAAPAVADSLIVR
jgi:hypothetical protein